MYKTLIGAGALVLATAAVPASAHDWYGDRYGGSGYYNNGCDSDDYGYGGGYYGRKVAMIAARAAHHDAYRWGY